MTTTDIEYRLSRARTQLLLNHPFVGSVALNMPFELSEAVPTAATDGTRVLFNPGFIRGLDDAELMFLVAHECFHPMLEHNYRRGNRDPRLWNMAADYVINYLLIAEGIGRMPSVGLHDPLVYDRGGRTAEAIYEYLRKEDDGSGGSNGMLDDCQDAPGDPAGQAQQQAEWRLRVAQAAQAARMAGRLSANMERFVGDILRPRVDWRDVLRRFVTRLATDQRTFARPARRFVSQGLYMPGITGETMGRLCVAVDCSGSVDDGMLGQFAAELRDIQETTRPEAIEVVYFDTRVCHTDTFSRDEPVVITPHGGGGTAFDCIFAHVAASEDQPVAVVVLTDLYSSTFGQAPECPVLWVTTGATEAPFGEVVKA